MCYTGLSSPFAFSASPAAGCFPPSDGPLRLQLFPLLLKEKAGVFVQSLSPDKFTSCADSWATSLMTLFHFHNMGARQRLMTFDVRRRCSNSTRLELLRVSVIPVVRQRGESDDE